VLARDKAIADLLGVAAPAEAPATNDGDDDSIEVLVSRPPAKRLSRVERAYTSASRLVACTDVSPLVQMAHDAFYEHRPITLSPANLHALTRHRWPRNFPDLDEAAERLAAIVVEHSNPSAAGRRLGLHHRTLQDRAAGIGLVFEKPV